MQAARTDVAVDADELVNDIEQQMQRCARKEGRVCAVDCGTRCVAAFRRFAALPAQGATPDELSSTCFLPTLVKITSAEKKLRQLKACTSKLKQQRASGRVDRGVQAELGGGSLLSTTAGGASGMPPNWTRTGGAHRQPQAFEYTQPKRRINWRRIHAFNVEQMVSSRLSRV
jgi:hypothetical protein